MPSLLGIVKVLPGTTRYYLALPEIAPAQRKEKPKSNGSFHENFLSICHVLLSNM